MSMERDLRVLLENIGHPVIWGMFGKDVSFPRISLQRVGTVTAYSLKGRSNLEAARVQVNIDSLSYGALISLGPQVSNLLTEFRGGSVMRCKELSRRDGSTETGGEVVRRQMLDFQVRYRA